MTRPASFDIRDDHELLELMMADASAQQDLYKPGPYWRAKSRAATREIRKHGLGDFRGSSSIIGRSFTDSVELDVRVRWDSGIRRPVRVLFDHVVPFKNVFNRQLSVTESFEAEARRLRSILLGGSERVRELLARYTIPPSMGCGCLAYVDIDNQRISTHYLNLLDQQDHVAEPLGLRSATSLFEIGGGFGVNVHLLLTNYPNIRKILYLDIPPALYVGTQYLRAIYGAAIRDYRSTRRLESIGFGDDDRLEIVMIAPWQLARCTCRIDVFCNAHSFVEMPSFVVANYASILARQASFAAMSIAMLSYESVNHDATLDPDSLPGFFPMRSFTRAAFPVLDRSYNVVSFVSRSGAAGRPHRRPEAPARD